MRAVMVMFDSLNRHMLSPYGCRETVTPNFERLARHSVQFDTCYAGSLPCMSARRELHTGRYNFLHRAWGPVEPFDDSMPEILSRMGVHTHLVTDHYHYWQDGGATYHTRYVGLLSAFYPKCTAYFHLDFHVRLTSSSLSPLWKLLLHFTWDEKFISLLKIA